MNDYKYILKGHTPVPVEDVVEWGRWFEKAKRHVGDVTLANGARVSTVFLGLDHNFGEGEPLLFETMVFDSANPMYLELDVDRYTTWEQAEEGHKRMVAKWKDKKL